MAALFGEVLMISKFKLIYFKFKGDYKDVLWYASDCDHLRHIENRTRGCFVDLFIRIAELYAVSLAYLIFGKNTDGKAVKLALEEIISTLTELYQAL